ncbi:MAG: tRNA lysidine(34) synthetase TilS [Opitutales bacterium]|nr:tRNA lysidine(34) synthetase TilS [Opitutales bacterium]
MRRKIKFGGADWLAELDESAYSEMYSLHARGSKIGVACSGGADSVYALYCVADIFADRLSDIFVLHYNHKVRTDSDSDERYVAELCAKLGLNFVRGEPDSVPVSPTEDKLRALRLDFFVKEFRKLGLSAIVQGHHCGDVLESMLMRLARGSSGDGLCVPRAISYFKGTVFLRPLLNLKKDAIIASLVASKIIWCEDSTNAGEDYFRNRIRNKVIPILEESTQADIYKSALRSRALLEEDSTALSDIFEREYNKLNELSRDATTSLLSEFLLSCKAFARRSIQRFLSENNIAVRASAVDNLVDKLTSKESFKSSAGQTQEGQKVFVCFDSEKLRLYLDSPKKVWQYSVPLKVGKNILPDGSAISVAKISLTKTRRESIKNGDNDDATTAYLDLDCIGNLENGVLVARTKQDGDKYAPLGSKSPKKLKEIYNAKKVPQMKRNVFPLVCNKKGEILWSPMLPPSDKYKIRNAGSALELTFSPR